ncbi:MAG TPA: tail fiber protein [Allosphingosinicella sp.]
MADPFLAEMRIMSFNFPPRGWALCNGQPLPINQNQALFSLLGTTYGGDGRLNFALPDYRGRTPLHVGNGHFQGERGGEEMHTLSIPEMPGHLHMVTGTSNDGTVPVPAGQVPARAAPANPYIGATALAAMNANSITNTGGSQPHENRQPYLTLSFCIALQGIFPSRN